VITRKCVQGIWILLWLAVTASCLATDLYAQDTAEVSVCIANVTSSRIEEGWLFGGSTTDLTVTWRVLRSGEEQDISTFDEYYVFCSEDTIFRHPEDLTENSYADTVTFTNMSSTKTYYFRVDALRGGRVASSSDIYQRKGKPMAANWTRIFPAYLIFSFLERVGIFDGGVDAISNSSPIGRIAFELIAVFLIVGLTFGCVKTHRVLRATDIFLVNQPKGKVPDECERIKNEVAPRFNLANYLAEKLYELACDRLTRTSFYGHKIIHKTLQSDIININSKLVKKRNQDSKKSRLLFKDIPCVRLAKTASYPYKTYQEINAALELRVVAEEEDLRKRSFIELLWGLGVTAPLVGLFGTVTGISQSFRQIMDRSPSEEFIMQNLSGGIFEALFTTIFGLIVGILLMLAYYYYNYKLDRIHSIWVNFAGEFLDQFKMYQNSTGGSPPAPSGGIPTKPGS